MDQLRDEARQALKNDPHNLPDRLPSATGWMGNLSQLWENVSGYDNSNTMVACESLYTAVEFLAWGFEPQLSKNKDDEIQATYNLFKWAGDLALPSSEFAVSFDETAEEMSEFKQAQEESRLKGELGISFIRLLTQIADESILPDGFSYTPGVLLALISFSSKQEPWTTGDAAESVSVQLDETNRDKLWPAIEGILKDKLKPLFTRQRNPNITSEGRKNLHPVPLPRFDGSALDDSTKPWKNTDIYATTAMSWIISNYKAEDKRYLEAHFPLLVPAILALIDDSNITFKIKGCQLLEQLLCPIRDSGSDILARTNLISVFEEAITPCLLSLPTITPEENSLKILRVAYPVLISLFKVDYSTRTTTRQSEPEVIKATYKNKLAKILRSNLTSSFNHVSYSGSSIESSASFPYPALSTFLLEQISIVIKDLGLDTTKYVQDIVPLLQATLSNPFGSAHPPLLSAAILSTRSLVLMAHNRVWRWRGELFDGLCTCWLHIRGEIEEMGERNRQAGHSKDRAQQLAKVIRELKVVVVVLKHALQNPVVVGATPDPDQGLAKQRTEEELRELVEADSNLRDLLLEASG